MDDGLLIKLSIVLVFDFHLLKVTQIVISFSQGDWMIVKVA
jgi:hypothetical protein